MVMSQQNDCQLMGLFAMADLQQLRELQPTHPLELP